jgi:outer membrane protein assembly factor BamE (lipoprotein component of BamABCDE complex)
MTPTSRLNKISVGMTKEQVIAAIGEPVSKAAQGGAEVFRYHLSTPEQMMWTGGHNEYYVRFVEGRVESFGRMGDFDSTKNPTIEVRTDSNVQSDSKVKIDDSGDLYTELKKLDELKKQGIITEQEFETQKKKLLDRK